MRQCRSESQLVAAGGGRGESLEACILFWSIGYLEPGALLVSMLSAVAESDELAGSLAVVFILGVNNGWIVIGIRRLNDMNSVTVVDTDGYSARVKSGAASGTSYRAGETPAQ